MRSSFAALLLAWLTAVAAAVLLFWADDVLRILIVDILQRRVGQGALRAAPVSLSSASMRGWSFEMQHLHIDNVPGNWSTPYALHMDRLRIDFGSLRGFLSLVQLPLAAAAGSPCILRLGGLEFIAGFRVKEVELIEMSNLTVHVENAPGADDRALPPAEGVLLRGQLTKEPLNGRLGPRRLREFVLERTGKISWFDPGSLPHPGEAAARERGKAKGSLRLYASSTVEMTSDGLGLELISNSVRMTLTARSSKERDRWRAAIEGVTDALARSLGEGSRVRIVFDNNAPWIEALDAENEARKATWRMREQRRRRQWRQRWKHGGDRDEGAHGAAMASGAIRRHRGGEGAPDDETGAEDGSGSTGRECWDDDDGCDV